MIARDALIERLLTGTAVAALVADRIYPHWAPQGITPGQAYLVVLQISAVRTHHTLGASGLVEARVQVDVFAGSLRAADELAKAVRQRLDGYRGPITVGTGGTAETLTLQQCHLDNEVPDIESWDPYAEAPAWSRVTQDYLIAHAE